MTRRSLSTLYRAEVRRNSGGVDAEQLLALATVGGADATVLERLARTPEAPTLRGVALSIGPWSSDLAEDLRRNRGGAAVRIAPRMRRLAWISVAAAASLAVVIVGFGSRGEPDASTQGFASRDSAAVHGAGADVLFADPDGMLIAAAHVDDSESIFADGLGL